MNKRLVPPFESSRMLGFAREMHRLQQLARFQKPSGVEVLTGRRAVDSIDLPGKRPSLLCLHGFCGVPQELEPALRVAQQLGLQVRAPLLPGHGEGPEALRPLRYQHWLAAAQREFDELRQQGPVFLLGMSMGSLLASELALSAPQDVLGLTVLANPVWMRSPFPGAALDLVRLLKLPDFGFPTSGRVAELRHQNQPVYHVQPVHAAVSIREAGRRLQGQIQKLQCPTLVIHGGRDEICPVQNAWRFASLLKTRDAQVSILPHSSHMLTLGKESHLLERDLKAFLSRQLAQA